MSKICFVWFFSLSQNKKCAKEALYESYITKRRVSKQMEEYKVQNQNAGKPEDKKKMF